MYDLSSGASVLPLERKRGCVAGRRLLRMRRLALRPQRNVRAEVDGRRQFAAFVGGGKRVDDKAHVALPTVDALERVVVEPCLDDAVRVGFVGGPQYGVRVAPVGQGGGEPVDSLAFVRRALFRQGQRGQAGVVVCPHVALPRRVDHDRVLTGNTHGLDIAGDAGVVVARRGVGVVARQDDHSESCRAGSQRDLQQCPQSRAAQRRGRYEQAPGR